MDKNEIIRTLSDAYFSKAPHESALLRVFPKLLQGVNVFVDLGASLGQFTKAAAKILQNGRILSVEADPLRYAELEKNAKEWEKLTGNKIQPIHAVIGSVDAPVTFHITNSNVSGGVNRNPLQHLDEGTRSKVRWESVDLPGKRLDSLLDVPPDLVKMDIEGGEFDALTGAERLLADGRTIWLVELHAFSPNQDMPERVRDLMSGYGYRELQAFGKSLFFQGSPWRFKSFWMRHAAGAPKRVFKRGIRFIRP